MFQNPAHLSFDSVCHVTNILTPIGGNGHKTKAFMQNFLVLIWLKLKCFQENKSFSLMDNLPLNSGVVEKM